MSPIAASLYGKPAAHAVSNMDIVEFTCCDLGYVQNSRLVKRGLVDNSTSTGKLEEEDSYINQQTPCQRFVMPTVFLGYMHCG